MNPGQDALVLAVDLGGTSVDLGLVDRAGVVRERCALQTADFTTPEDLARELGAWRRAREQALGRHISAVGIGAPNGCFARGTIESAPNLEWPGRVPLAALVEAATGLPTKLDNDANVAALGQGRFGLCRGLADFVVVTLGTGIGAGLVVGGQLVRGASGLAGELGHLTCKPDGRPCNCGRCGCIETYVSGAGLGQTFVELAAREGRSVAARTAEQLFEQALAGDHLARETFNLSGRYLAGALVDLSLLVAPERIVFTGGLTRAGELLLEPLARHYAAELPDAIPPAALAFDPGSDTTLAGAAALAWFDERSSSM